MGIISRNYKSKTFWGGIVAVLTATGSMFGVPIPTEVFIVMGALEAIFVRDAISKNGQ